MSEMDKYLKGSPSKSLVRKVRRHLKFHGIVPVERLWRLTWEWAASVACSYQCDDIMFATHKRSRPRWPSEFGIGAQYVALLLAEMRDGVGLKLPYRAADQMPVAVRVALAPRIPFKPELPGPDPDAPLMLGPAA